MTAAPVSFRVNGRETRLALDANTPLLLVLRNELNLKGPRFGCGAGACGSCAVLLDGKTISSCDVPLWAAQDREVTTVEGLGTPDRPHPVQQAFLDLQAAQCGYCINGIMMSVAALQAQSEPVTEAGLQAALARHLCRCGTHLRILQAARRVLGLPPPSA